MIKSHSSVLFHQMEKEEKLNGSTSDFGGEPACNLRDGIWSPKAIYSYSHGPWQLEDTMATFFRSNIFTKLQHSNQHPSFFSRRKPDKFL